MPLDQLIASFGEFLPFIQTKLDIVLYNVFPFNLIKGLVIGGFTMLTYKHIREIKKCLSVCPQSCIDVSRTPVEINQNHCLHCGRCWPFIIGWYRFGGHYESE